MLTALTVAPHEECSCPVSKFIYFPICNSVLFFTAMEWKRTGKETAATQILWHRPTPKRLCNDISGQRGHRGRPPFVWGPLVSRVLAWSSWTDVKKKKKGWGQTNSQWSVCLGFLRGDSSSQSLSNGNQLTANKAIARLGLFAFVVDLWRRWWGAGGVLFIVLYSPKALQRRREKFVQGRVYFEPCGFYRVFPEQKICWCALK